MKSHLVGQILFFSLVTVAPASAATCESLASLKLPETTITSASVVEPGQFMPPLATPNSVSLDVYKHLPAFCRVQASIRPSSDSDIEFEVWLPTSAWNGKYLGVGNGAFAGSINYNAAPDGNSPGMPTALASGYATSSTDTGHKGKSGNDAEWAPGHPEKVIDYGYRGIHETAEKSKAIIRAFYGVNPQGSYFNSCSGGGRQALMEAQRFPADYNGIVAGDPNYFSTHLAPQEVWTLQALTKTPESYIPTSKLPAIEAAVLTACDAKDGFIGNPAKCHFDPAKLLCKNGDSDACLTQPQIEALRKIYAGPRSSKGEQIYPGMVPGAETGPGGWGTWILGSEPGKSSQAILGVGFIAQFLYNNADWDYRTFNFDRDVKAMDEKLGPIRNTINPDLKSFKDRGGKLILYHGWSDPAITPLGTIDYYESVVSKMGQKDVNDFVRLYMAPGMHHCGGGPGPNFFDSLSAKADSHESVQLAIEQWVRDGAAPSAIIATKFNKDGDPASGIARMRPLCPYPQEATYKGTGSIDDAANFVCKSPSP